ncbi:SSI family serine proteinase inhibitor [Amycolatopsis anabasis]|uniref:SSI family serine proteinase inhibitor n=1 Tax=Amycolatopsis anabasis TaxID=1840409 RepID=UPI00131EC44D|nr:SSI family serine proteinase inhibitor [Amycolatopsis anabasis]
MALFAIEPITACALALASLAGPAQPASFDLTTTNTKNETQQVSLTCDPAGGTHPKSGEACAAIARANGDFDKLPVRRQACTLEYSPITATAKGNWRGKAVDFTREYPNKCAADAESSGVFKF